MSFKHLLIVNLKKLNIKKLYDMHVKEGESRKPKAKLKSKKTCKPSITKSIGEERLIHRGIKKLSFFFFKKKHHLETTVGKKRL